MPLWKIYHPEGAFSPEQKQDIAQTITGLYAPRLPKFYVGVVFQAVAADAFFVGGEPATNFVRIWVDHIARTLPNAEARTWWVNHCVKTLAPFIGDRGFDWEFHIDETSYDLWAINGMRPPLPDTEDEKRWKVENRPSPLTAERAA